MDAIRRSSSTIDDYIAGFPRRVQTVPRQVRAAIRKALPKVEESISYGIPTYKINGRPVVYFGGFKQHYSIYPANARLIAAFKRELAPYEFNEKGTIRFPLDEPVPTALIGNIAKFRAKEAAVTTSKMAGKDVKDRGGGTAPGQSGRPRRTHETEV